MNSYHRNQIGSNRVGKHDKAKNKKQLNRNQPEAAENRKACDYQKKSQRIAYSRRMKSCIEIRESEKAERLNRKEDESCNYAY